MFQGVLRAYSLTHSEDILLNTLFIWGKFNMIHLKGVFKGIIIISNVYKTPYMFLG